MKSRMTALEDIIDDIELAALALTSVMLCDEPGVCALNKHLAGLRNKVERLLKSETKKDIE
ncbi:hypothetical protein [Vibrio quintilis]|uniref:Uncharacterized protein n=1 Tax=Vibrio quintilis TaxID=1117707 RepID=A0A1M7YNZ6_9VIBR|nr:hypothetical protein [Vibrio quintilis]SHO54362.1 hypothetical protein VQ7734_00076 [Vibrio quintilis]